MGVANRPTPEEGFAPQLGEPSCDIPNAFGYPPGTPNPPIREDFRGFARDLFTAAVRFPRGIVDVLEKRGAGEQPGELTCSG